MAIANFFDKAALNASQILQNYNRESFEKTLNEHHLAIVFGRNATSTKEGKAALDLLIRLSARLYPNISLINVGGSKKIENQLEKLCLSINPLINIEKKKKPTIFIFAGLVEYDTKKNSTFYIGSNGWKANFSIKNSLEFSKSNNIFGAACAVCFGLSNVFRKIFESNLPHGKLDTDFSFSAFHFTKDYNQEEEEDIEFVNDVKIGELFLVGVGAIGNSVLWALNKLPAVSGKIHLIDKEEVDLSNLQRYVLAVQEDVKKLKVDIAEDFMTNSKIKIDKVPLTWQDFLSKRKNWNIENVAVCVDSAEDRMAIQATLPQNIFNAWTQQESIGISRHYDFLNTPCLMCLYFPEYKKKSRSEEVSINLGIPQHEVIVREYLATGKPIDSTFINLVCEAKKIEFDKLKDYVGETIEVFHSKTVCGGTLMTMSNEEKGEQHNIEVPLAFESALAGILLASEVVIFNNKLRKHEIPVISNLNLLRPISEYVNEKQSKHHKGRCICCDNNFRKVYKDKWN